MYILQITLNACSSDFGRKMPQLIYAKFLTVTIIMCVYIKRKSIKEMSYEKHFRYAWFVDSNLNGSKTDLLLLLLLLCYDKIKIMKENLAEYYSSWNSNH